MNFTYSYKTLVLTYPNKSGRHKGTITCRHKSKYYYTKTFKNLDYNYSSNINNSVGIIISNLIDLKLKTYISLFIFIEGSLYGKKRFILNTLNISSGDLITFKTDLFYSYGCVRNLFYFPVGSFIYNVENIPNTGASIARAPGSFVKILYIDWVFVCIKLPSNKIKLVSKKCKAYFGKSTFIKNYVKKAGYNRLYGVRPSVRGIVMNPIDHPHGGGVGKTSIGLKCIKTPWGKYAFGIKTRSKTKYNFKYMII